LDWLEHRLEPFLIKFKFSFKYDKYGHKLWHKCLGSSMHDFLKPLARYIDTNVYMLQIVGALYSMNLRKLMQMLLLLNISF